MAILSPGCRAVRRTSRILPATYSGSSLTSQPGNRRGAVTIEHEANVPFHVVPALEWIFCVLRSVDLYGDLAVVPRRVDPAPSATPVPAGRLAAWLGKPEWANNQANEVEFGKRLRSAGYVAEGLDDRLPTAERLCPIGHQPEIGDPDQSLLHPRGKDRHRTPIGRHPGSGVDQRPLNPRPPWLPHRMHVRVSQPLRVVRDDVQPEWRRTPLVAIGDKQVNRAVSKGGLIVKTLESVQPGSGESRQGGPRPSPEQHGS